MNKPVSITLYEFHNLVIDALDADTSNFIVGTQEDGDPDTGEVMGNDELSCRSLASTTT